MTRKEAIMFLKNANAQSELALKELSKVEDKAERIGKIGEYYANFENCVKEIEACNMAISALEELEKITAKINVWIPCSEKYPEWGTTSYLVCLKNGGIFLALYLSSGEFKEISSMGIREFCENNPVVAWMPLPEPYEVKENG